MKKFVSTQQYYQRLSEINKSGVKKNANRTEYVLARNMKCGINGCNKVFTSKLKLKEHIKKGIDEGGHSH